MQGSHLWVRITLTFGSFNGTFACLGHAKSLQSHKACWMCPSWCRWVSRQRAACRPAVQLWSHALFTAETEVTVDQVCADDTVTLSTTAVSCLKAIVFPFMQAANYKSLHLTHLRKCFETWHTKIASDLLVLTLGDSGAKRRVRSWRLKFHAKQ